MNPQLQISISASHLGLFLVLTGALMIGVSIPLAWGKVRMNDWFGVRIPKAFETESNWYSINRFGGRWMIGGGVILTALGAVAIVFPPAHPGTIVLFALAPVATLVAILIRISIFAGRLP